MTTGLHQFAKAQDASLTRITSFFADIHTDEHGNIQPQFLLDDAVILDDQLDSMMLFSAFDAGSLDSSMVRCVFNSHKVYRYRYDSAKHSSLAVDSMLVAKRQMENFIEAIRQPLVLTWSDDIFYKSTILSRLAIDSAFEKCNTARKKARDILEQYRTPEGGYKAAYHLDTTYLRLRRDSRGVLCRGYYKISNPIFSGSGTIALLYIRYHIPPMYIGSFIRVYRLTNERWHYFGEFLPHYVN